MYNLVWLVQDHVPWKHVRDTSGPKSRLSTYERVKEQGVEFLRAYTPTPLCSPARGSLLTGVYPHKHGIVNNLVDVTLNREQGTNTGVYSSYLSEKGYRLGYFGKWHSGNGKAEDVGFEGFSLPEYGDPYASPEYAKYLEEHGLPNPSATLEWSATGKLWSDADLTQKGIEPDPSKGGIGVNSAGVMNTPLETTESYFLAKLAENWLEERAGDRQPFVLRVDLWGPHQPYLVAEPFANTIDPSEIPEYPSFRNSLDDRPSFHKRTLAKWREKTGFTRWEEWQPIMARAYEHFAQTDACLGIVLDVLERTGLDKNTIIIYTADHGDIVGSNGGLFDKDAMMTEETMSIPLAIKWPGVTEGTQACDALVSNMDLVPTLLELAGIPAPAHMDGRSLVPLLRDPEHAKWREDLMAEHFGHLEYEGLQRVLYWQNFKYVAHQDDIDELYDLEEDPFELHNLIDDPKAASLLQEMRTRLLARMKEFADTSEASVLLMQQRQSEGEDE